MYDNNQQPNQQRSMFQDPADEERLCQILKAYVEEWGPEHVFVSVPKHWKEYGSSGLGRVRLYFETQDSVVIGVVDEANGVSIEYEIALALA